MAAPTAGPFIAINGRNLTYNSSPLLLRGINFDNNPALALGPPGTPSDITKVNVRNDEYQTVGGWGGNAVRFGMDYNWYSNDPAQFFSVMDQHVQYAKANQLWLIPALFVPPGGTTGGYSQACLWSSCAGGAANRQALVDFWRAFAQHYQNEPTVAGYDLINEPAPPAISEWQTLGQTLRDTITAADANHLVLFESDASGLFAAPLTGSNVLYSDHHYAPLSYVADNTPGACGVPGPPTYPGNCEGRFWDRASMLQYIQNGEFVDYNFSVTNNVPILVGEFGAITSNVGYAQYDSDNADIFNQLGVSWTYYTMRQTSDFAIFPCPVAGDMTCGDAGAIGALQPKMSGSVRPPAPAPTGNPVQRENLNAGNNGWIMGPQISDDATGQVKAYASATSVTAGDTLRFSVSVNPAQTYSLDIYRIGWYGGFGGRLMSHVGPVAGTTQPACPLDATTGMISCQWSTAYSVNVPSTWTSGAYLALLTNAAGYQNYVPFVVRDSRVAAILYQQSVTTYQAYNDYPDDNVRGKSLYEFNSFGPNTMAGTPRAVKVSYDRPYSDDGSGQFFDNEITFVQWAERQGYDMTYSTDVDTHTNGARLLQGLAFLSVGHDEYWSTPMYNAAAAARDAGVNLGFFGANDIFWQVRFEPSAGGVANRVMVCYKSAALDPGQGALTTVNFRDPPVNRPEQALMGIQWTALGNYGTDFPYVVDQPNYWIFRGTGLTYGATIPGVVGYETDRYMPQFPMPAFRNYMIVSRSPFTDTTGASDVSHSVMYQAPSGAWVFDAGTIDWSHGLDFATGNDRSKQITANILNQFTMPRGPASSINRVQVGNYVKAYQSSVNLTLPAASTAGTLLVATIGADGTSAFSGPAGWIRAASAVGSSSVSEVWYRPNNPGGITSAVFTSPGGAATAGALSEWSGVATVSPLDGSGSSVANSTTTASVFTGNVASGGLVITSYSPFRVNGGALTFTRGAGYNAIATDATQDWFHFAADYSIGVRRGWMGETVSASAPVNWAGAIATFRSP